MALVGVFHLWRCRRKFVLGASFIGPVRVKHEACMSQARMLDSDSCVYFFFQKKELDHISFVKM